MPRPRSVPDSIVHEAVLDLRRAGGDKAVTFGAVAARAGLAASSLAQRHKTVAGMIRDAENGLWQRLDDALTEAAGQAPASPKGAAALLKALSPLARNLPVEAPAAEAWRARVEAELALRLGSGGKARDAAAALFAAWQGLLLWEAAGGRPVRLKDLVKRIAP
ncbi:MAG: transcriptional regulator [Gemmobacter sp.]